MKIKNIGIIIGDISKGAGTERSVVNLANLLINYGLYNVILISVSSKVGQSPFFELDKRVKIISLDISLVNKYHRIFSYFECITRITNIIKNESLDVLIGTTHAFNILMFFCRKKIIKIACEHLNYSSCPTVSSVFRRIVYPRLDSIVLLTDSDAKHYSFLPNEKKHVIQNTLSFITNAPSKLDSKRIISIGRLSKQKGFDLLIHVARSLKRVLPDWYIDIYGEGEEKNSLENLINEYDLTQYVKIKKPIKDIKRELLASSLYLMTSRWEGLPMVLLEAQACGLPLISFNCPEGPSEIIHEGIDGFLIANGNIEMMVDKIVQICTNTKMRVEFGNNSFISSAKYSSLAIYTKWEDLFNSLSKNTNK